MAHILQRDTNCCLYGLVRSFAFGFSCNVAVTYHRIMWFWDYLFLKTSLLISFILFLSACSLSFFHTVVFGWCTTSVLQQFGFWNCYC
ncbi:L-ascorbate peroxidase 2 cytosolic [Zea mays]|uniref:L-ascorbate peroxidase 2 cytosolic n=1 Tax=Zea mays TaxID=4577 RepID=A0A1D6QVA3_MAIZE|nr:L-ascorbate peroxidase 2 cytosolic [Zea mays]